MKASWNGTVIAESDDIVTVERNAYFPLSSVKAGVLQESATKSVCPWKGTASYYSLMVDGKENKDAAWFYPAPKEGRSRDQGSRGILERRDRLLMGVTDGF